MPNSIICTLLEVLLGTNSNGHLGVCLLAQYKYLKKWQLSHHVCPFCCLYIYKIYLSSLHRMSWSSAAIVAIRWQSSGNFLKTSLVPSPHPEVTPKFMVGGRFCDASTQGRSIVSNLRGVFFIYTLTYGTLPNMVYIVEREKATV